jgi:hypothetical protein
MLEGILKRLRHDKRGVSNAIVVMLSLVMVVIVASNVVLWSYEMNQLDWEKMQEKISIANVEHLRNSPWFTSQSEYAIDTGSSLYGTFADTRTIDNLPETFREETEPVNSTYRLIVTNDFMIDSDIYPVGYINSLEILVRYNVTDNSERWFLKAFNWTTSTFSDSGLNVTSGSPPVAESWNGYAVNLTDHLRSYVSSNGTVRIQFQDEGVSGNQILLGLDFFGVRALIDGARLELRNSGSLTMRIVSIWIVNKTQHEHFDANLFLNSGDEVFYVRADMKLPENGFTARIVTHRGNVAVFP